MAQEKMTQERMEELAQERALSLLNRGPGMAQYKTFGIPQEQKEEFIKLVQAKYELLIKK